VYVERICYDESMNTTEKHLHRDLALIDIENIVGGPNASSAIVDVARTLITQHLQHDERDQSIVALSHHAARVAAFGWDRGTRQKWQSGQDGADLALLEELDVEKIVGRFESITIVSGDGIFGDAVERLRAEGIRTTVIGRGRSISWRLYRAADKVIELPDLASYTSAA